MLKNIQRSITKKNKQVAFAEETIKEKPKTKSKPKRGKTFIFVNYRM